MSSYRLNLYISGRSGQSDRIISKLRALLDEALPDDYTLKVVDVLEQPEIIDRMKISFTPVLVLEHPLPVRRVFGDLSDTDQVLQSLNLPHEF